MQAVSRYTLKDYAREAGMSAGQLAAYRRQCAWNKKMQGILKTSREGKDTIEPHDEEKDTTPFLRRTTK